MSEALVITIVLAVVVLVAVAAVVVVLRRRPPAGPMLDEEALRRLVVEAVGRPATGPAEEAAPAEPDLGRFALLSHEAAAAAEAADTVRRTATEAADELLMRSRRDADQ